jgi:hypothetical protein
MGLLPIEWVERNPKSSIAQAQGVCLVHDRTASAGKTPDCGAVPGFRKAPVPDPLGETRIAELIGPTEVGSDANP